MALLEYFGEGIDACGNCDVCLDPSERVDGTEDAKKILSAAYRSGQRFGAAHLIDILRGTGTDKIARFGHDRLPTFGVGAERGKNEWRSLIRQMVATGFLRIDIGGYGGIGITEKGLGLLRGEGEFLYREDTIIARTPAKARDSGAASRRCGGTAPGRRRHGAAGRPQSASPGDRTGARRTGLYRVPRPHVDRHGAAPAAHQGGVRRGQRRRRSQAEGVRGAVLDRHRYPRRQRGLTAEARMRVPMTRQIVITEKASQAKDVRAAVGSRYGAVLAAEGHLLDLCEPEDVNPAWKRWSTALLKPDGLYGTKPATGGNKAAKLKAIRAALKTAERVWLATDCDREGQLIGQEILEHCRYRGEVLRVLFTAQDAETIRAAFGRARPNGEHARLYEAAVARRQADQIYNLSLTRTATVTLGRGSRGVIGIGRVKTPTLAIACRRELEIREFVAVGYFEVVATAHAESGEFKMRHAPKERIVERGRAEAVAEAAREFEGPLGVRVEDKRQRPPRLHDLPSLQKLCSSRFGWTASKTLEVAQSSTTGRARRS